MSYDFDLENRGYQKSALKSISDFPFRVDVVEFRDVSEAFKKIAKQDVIEIN